MRKLFPLLVFLLASYSSTIQAQQLRRISGTVLDHITGKPLPYTTLGLKRSLIGVVTNENGEFDLYIPDDAASDTLLVNAFGYKRQAIPLKNAETLIHVRMHSAALEIEEVKVTPKPPEFYIREAMRRVKENYPSSPFVTVGYYRQKILENNGFLQCDEAVFKTFCPNYQDTVKNHDQLLLFRKVEEIREMTFMSRELAKAEEKKKKQKEKEKKQNEKNEKKGKAAKTDTTSKKKSGITIDPGASSFGGPETILKSSRMGEKFWGFLDTTQLDEYRYSFSERTSFGNHNLMVINFASRGKVNHLRENGHIYIDEKNFAIVRIENTGDLVIPVLIRPIIFMYGLGIENPDYSRNLEFQEVNGKWYPQKIQYHVEAKLTKRYWFEPNDHSHFQIDQIFAVNKLTVENPQPVPAEKRFNPKKPMNEQVHNDENLSWGQMNVIKR